MDMNAGKTPTGSTITGFPTRAEALTPSDDTVYRTGRMVCVGAAGDVTVQPLNSAEPVTFSLEAGQFVPVVVRRVLATGTTATDLVGVY